jgi:hypothetical protein
MSAVGTKRTSLPTLNMSAVEGEADLPEARGMTSVFVPEKFF